MGNKADYAIPEGILGLSGPVKRPRPGTLPLRGDLAHIALAGTHLAAHYVVPHLVTARDAMVMHTGQNTKSDVSAEVETGEELELLDVQGDWAWVCKGPQGPSGFVPLAQLERTA